MSSFTAYNIVVTLGNLAADARWKPYVPTKALPLIGAFREYAADTLGKRFAAWLPAKMHLALMEALFVPGMAVHFLMRKRWIEERVRQAMEKGYAQFAVIGAGYDTLALRLSAEYPHTRWYELDLPQTQNEKKKVMAAAGIACPGNLHFEPCDLAARPVDEILPRIKTYREQDPLFVVIEGVLMYVPETSVKDFFRRLSKLGKVQVAYGALAASDHESSSPMLRMVAGWLGKMGEPIRWTCTLDAMPDFVKEAGFSVLEATSYQQMQQPVLSPQEWRKLPAEDENYFLIQNGA